MQFAEKYAVSPDLTTAEAVAPPLLAQRSLMGALPFERYSIRLTEERIDLYFWDRHIVCADFHWTDDSPTDWSDAEIALERLFEKPIVERQKRRNDNLLRQLLGDALPNCDDTGNDAAVSFVYPWGQVASLYGVHKSYAFIRVEYEGRRAVAQVPFARIRPHTGAPSIQSLRNKLRQRH